ncbi:hypothetical protein SH591_11055 [Sphingomonas sp. LY54]|uniref:hypothetical protein n=1 Tax=Sphingomonas sp. LY54 TaxID=3095343 RepID=UPI002D79F05E|nr:hypothetical protein [Sphingomonas sp. LY54]WRP27654.1 hypothetical protein SH591_11055 [Sphingomonas sp. LY54]
MSDSSEFEERAMWFLHRVDPVGRKLRYVHAIPSALRAATFLDGRTTFWEGTERVVDFAQAQPSGTGGGSIRYIFHVSFCGSTLLASVLDEACEAFVLKEPQCLVDLADWKKTLRQHHATDPAFGGILDVVQEALLIPGQATVVKPSNWANNIVADLCSSRRSAERLFLTMDAESFLRAVFRGGRDRIAFTARVAGHLASAFGGGQGLVAQAISETADPLGRAANLCALTHYLQLSLFEAACPDWKDSGSHLDFAEISGDLEGAVRKAAAALGLTLSDALLLRALDRWQERNAKQHQAVFSKAAHAEADMMIGRVHGKHIADALRWADGLQLPAAQPPLDHLPV